MSDDDTAATILITGATGGLGRALALVCAEQGARPVLLDRNAKALERLCDEVEHTGAPAPGYCPLDLAQAGPEQCQALVDGLVEAYGGVDALVHCAARFDGLQPIDQVPGDAWLEHMQVNVNAPWLLTRTCLSSLKSRQGAVLFCLNGPAAAGHAYWGPYGVAQGALQSMVSTLAEELEGSGCRVYGVDPGPMRTGLRARAYHAEDPSTVPDPAIAAAAIHALLRAPAQGEVFQSLAGQGGDAQAARDDAPAAS